MSSGVVLNKKATTEKGLKVNVKKTKAFCTGERTVAMETSKLPCSVCRSGTGRNSILWTKCNCWVHKRCSGTRKCLSKAVDFGCRIYSDFKGSTQADKEVTLDDDVVEKVAKFFSSGGKMQEAVTARIRCGWKKFRDIANVLCKKSLSLKM